MFYSKRFSFRSKRGTTDGLVEITEQIRQGSIDKVLYILLDLRKAFDSINHEILLPNLEKHRVRGICVKWFESFLKGRRQCVQVNDVVSDFS